MTHDVLRITDLTRRYGTVLANDSISLRVRAGEVVGLLGHNGVGKSTLVSQVVGLLKPDAGQIMLGGTAEGNRAAHEASEKILLERLAEWHR